ncbi:hypothetical protein JQK87_03515 [Streptomyces sp. G44]|uniref:hypothetical protein n=1 Tax=Streptomyces sp. G44 TaxID=2807632 RepID=UPI0019621A98|nr:hypothetical protein [Streptomyces sp. G44]MBM7167497.1 hypothetical protein [Streptomyces sp. G44]
MTSTHVDMVEQQADITRLLLHHVHAPVTGTHFIRGVLPASGPSAVIRVVLGEASAYTPDDFIAYEIPLQWDNETVTAQDITAILRTLVTGTRIYSSDHISQVMGMVLVRVDPSALDTPGPTTNDRALGILRCFAQPYTDEKPNPLLRGFCFLKEDRLRLYLHAAETREAVAVDVRPSHATTALLASLPSLLDEDQYRADDDSDPHCAHVVNLIDW